MFFYFDPTYIFVLIGAMLMMFAQAKVSRAYSKYGRVRNTRGMSGAEVARQILAMHHIQDVEVEQTGGHLSDHYDPTHKKVRLSREIYEGTSVASLAVAAHECGHVIQHATGYGFLKFRSALLPVANLGSKIGWVAIFIGFISGELKIVYIGIACLALMLLFQIVTLPVEFDASGRALRILEGNQFLSSNETGMAREMLQAWALTYIASVASTILSLLRLFLLASHRDN